MLNTVSDLFPSNSLIKPGLKGWATINGPSFFLFSFWDRVSLCIFGQPRTHYKGQTSFELTVTLLSQSPKSQDYRPELLCLAGICYYTVLNLLTTLNTLLGNCMCVWPWFLFYFFVLKFEKYYHYIAQTGLKLYDLTLNSWDSRTFVTIPNLHGLL